MKCRAGFHTRPAISKIGQEWNPALLETIIWDVNRTLRGWFEYYSTSHTVPRIGLGGRGPKR